MDWRRLRGQVLFLAGFGAAAILSAQTAGLSVGGGGTLNMNTSHGFTGGPTLSAAFGFTEELAAGLLMDFTLSPDDDVLDIAALGRWYPPLTVLDGAFVPFAQAEAGFSLDWHYASGAPHGTGDSTLYPRLRAGLAIGGRVPLSSMGGLYLDVAVRGGYPFLFGADLVLGWQFDSFGELYYDSYGSGSSGNFLPDGGGSSSGGGEEIYETIE